MKDINVHYNELWMESRHYIAWRKDAVADAIVKTFNPATVVDVGCAIGDIVQGLLERGVQCNGIDAADAIKGHYMAPESTFWQRDIRKPFRFDVFDLCCCFDTLTVVEKNRRSIAVKNLCDLSQRILVGIPEEERTAFDRIFNQQGYQRNEQVEWEFKSHLESLKDKQAVKGIYGNTVYYETVQD